MREGRKEGRELVDSIVAGLIDWQRAGFAATSFLSFYLIDWLRCNLLTYFREALPPAFKVPTYLLTYLPLLSLFAISLYVCMYVSHIFIFVGRGVPRYSEPIDFLSLKNLDVRKPRLIF